LLLHLLTTGYGTFETSTDFRSSVANGVKRTTYAQCEFFAF
jgi:hypothetical protein